MSLEGHSESAASEHPAVFLSCLGTSPYRELLYAPLEGEPDEVSPFRSRFIQHARLEALGRRGVDFQSISILVTGEETGSRVKNWLDGGHPSLSEDTIACKGLATCLRDAGFAEAEPIDIPLGSNETEMWDIFNTVAELVPDRATIYVDLTHGFRTLPVLVLLALEYVEKVKDAKIVELTYGADRVGEEGLAPTWNLEPFLVIRKWADAVEIFLQYGDTRPLAECAREPARDLKKHLKRDMPVELYQLRDALLTFGEAIQKCYSPGVLKAGVKLKDIVRQAGEQSREHGPLRPLSFLLHRVEDKLEHFPSSTEEPGANLLAQWAAAEWCAQHGLAIQCFTFLREGFVQAFEELLQRRADIECTGDRLVGYLGALASGADLHPEAKEVISAIERAPLTSPEVWQGVVKHLGALIALRNKLNHAYNGHEDGAPLTNLELEKKAGLYLELFKMIILEIANNPGAAREKVSTPGI